MGTERCLHGMWSGQCTGVTEPSAEICNGKDDDCDGQIDNGFANIGQSCTDTNRKGACQAGVWACVNDQKVCQQTVQASNEICDGKDNDCDGQIDNRCGFFWAVSPGGAGWNVAESIAVDSSGHLYIAGYFSGTAVFGSTTLSTQQGSNRMFVAKLSNQGTFVWVVSAGGAGWDSARSIAIDSSDDLYVTGRFEGTTTFGTMTLTSKDSHNIFITKLR